MGSGEAVSLFSIVVPTKIWQHSNVVGQIVVECKTEISYKSEGQWQVDPMHANDVEPINHNFRLNLK